jgi:hypothetical protein
MAYAILSHSGVDVGKQDFLGPVTSQNQNDRSMQDNRVSVGVWVILEGAGEN